MKLFWKVLLAALIPLIFVLGFSLFQVERSVRIHEASVEAENKLKTSLLQVRLSAFLSDMKKTQAILSGSNEVARAVQAADTDFLTYWGQMFLDESSSQKIIFADRDGVVLARPHAPYILDSRPLITSLEAEHPARHRFVSVSPKLRRQEVFVPDVQSIRLHQVYPEVPEGCSP